MANQSIWRDSRVWRTARLLFDNHLFESKPFSPKDSGTALRWVPGFGNNPNLEQYSVWKTIHCDLLGYHQAGHGGCSWAIKLRMRCSFTPHFDFWSKLWDIESLFYFWDELGGETKAGNNQIWINRWRKSPTWRTGKKSQRNFQLILLRLQPQIHFRRC